VIPGPFFELLHLIAGRMRQRAEITHIKPAAARFAFVKVFNGGPPVRFPMIVPRGIVGVIRAKS